ncbi:MAG: hypothetical protein U0Q11_24445 [Vicinamibacterales bacterium]
MSRPRRFGASICRPATPCPDGSPAEGRRALLRAHREVERGQLREAPDEARDKLFFENLTPLYPQERIRLETTTENLAGRVMDNDEAPIGKGQRGLIVAPPRTDGDAVAGHHPDQSRPITPRYVIVLLIDERPEEVPAMQRSVAK